MQMDFQQNNGKRTKKSTLLLVLLLLLVTVTVGYAVLSASLNILVIKLKFDCFILV